MAVVRRRSKVTHIRSIKGIARFTFDENKKSII